MTRGTPGDISLGLAKPTREVRLGAVHGPGAFPHLPDGELNPISFSCEFLLLCKGPLLPDLMRLVLHEAVRFCSFYARDQNHEYHYYYNFIPKGLEQPMRSKCWGEVGSVQDQRGRRAGPLSSTLKRKIPAKCLEPGRTVLQGPGLLGPLQRDLRKRAPLFRASSW